MWFKKQEKPADIYLYGAYGSLFRCSAADVAGKTAQWLLGEVNKGRAAIAANQAAGDTIRRQEAEIEGLARELDERRAWEAKIKEEYDTLAKQQAQDAHDAESMRVCLDSLGLILEHRDAELDEVLATNRRLTRELSEASVEFEKDDALFDEAADEIERLGAELMEARDAQQKAEDLLDESINANKQIKAEVEALRTHLAAAVSRQSFTTLGTCACKAKKGKAK